MQRLHEDDLTGRLLAQGGWEHISFPAIADREKEYRWQTPYGPRRHLRRDGDVLHPEREPRHVLEELRQALGSYAFAGQYQQSPAPLGGGLVKPEWFRRYTEHELPDQFDYKLQSWDTANKSGDLANYTVCTTWGVRGRKIYLLHVVRRRLSYLDLKTYVKSQAEIFSPKVILVEDKASGTPLIQDLGIESLSGVVGYLPDGDKVVRMRVQAALIESGEVYVPQTAPWLDEYLHELSTFPRARFSDQVDSTSQALDWIKKYRNPSAQGYVEYYRRLAEGVGVQPPLGPTVAMEAPPTVQRSRINHGRVLTKGPDGLFQVPKDAVTLMLAAGWRLKESKN